MTTFVHRFANVLLEHFPCFPDVRSVAAGPKRPPEIESEACPIWANYPARAASELPSSTVLGMSGAWRMGARRNCGSRARAGDYSPWCPPPPAAAAAGAPSSEPGLSQRSPPPNFLLLRFLRFSCVGQRWIIFLSDDILPRSPQVRWCGLTPVFSFLLFSRSTRTPFVGIGSRPLSVCAPPPPPEPLPVASLLPKRLLAPRPGRFSPL